MTLPVALTRRPDETAAGVDDAPALDNGRQRGIVEVPHVPFRGATMVSFRAPPGRFRTRACPAAVVFAVSVVLTLLSGCGNDDAEPEAIPTVPETSSSAPGPTPTSPSASSTPGTVLSPQRRAAEAALDRYLQVEARLYADPDLDVAALDDVSYGLARSQAEGVVGQLRERGVVQTGPSEVMSREVTERQLGADPPTLVFEQCTDLTRLQITENGKPFEGRTTERNLTTYGVSFWQEKWQVSFIELNGPDQC